MLTLIDIMTLVYYEGMYFIAQHILVPANSSPWAGYTKVILWAIWVDPQSWAHWVTPPFPNPGGLVEAQKVCRKHRT